MSYPRLKLDLDEDGITFIQGKVGSGKSAILEAIFYLLTGKISRKKSSIKDFENKVTKSGYDISLKISVGNKEIVIREIRDRKPSGDFFGEDPRKGLNCAVVDAKGTVSHVSGKTDRDTRDKINKLIGISLNDLNSMAILLQRQRQDLVEGTPGKRAAAIIELFGLEKFDEVISLCTQDASAHKEEAESISTKITEYREELEDLAADIDDEPPEEEEYDENSLSELNKSISKARTRLEKLADRKKDIEHEQKLYERARDKARRKREVQKDIKELEEKLEDFSDVEGSIGDLESKISEKKENLRWIIKEIGDISREIEDINNNPDNCPITEEDCPVDVPVKYKAKRIDKLEKTMGTKESKCKKLKKCLKPLEKNKSILEDKKEIEDSIKNKTLVIKSLSEDVPDFDAESAKEEREKCIETISKGKNFISKLESKKENIIEAKARYDEFFKNRNKVVKIFEKRKNDLKELQSRYSEIVNDAEYLDLALGVFSKARMIKIDLILSMLNENIEKMLDEISGGELTAAFSSGKLDSTGKRVLDQIDLVVADANKTLPVGMWSGGQITQVGLAILLSVFIVARTLSGKTTNFLWLDEPFGPLDDELVDKIFGAINKISKELEASSVKIISHRKLDARVWDHKWKISINNGLSELRRV